MKEDILRLRAEGLSYNKIVEILGCAKSTVCYHCGDGQKEKANKRSRDRLKDKDALIAKKVACFKHKSRNRVRDFQRKRDLNGNFINGDYKKSFSVKDFLIKVGDKPKCYLTGRDVDIYNNREFQLDHIIPVSKGGSSDIDNVGVTCKDANIAKGSLKLDDFLKLCEDVLLNNGYKVGKPKKS